MSEGANSILSQDTVHAFGSEFLAELDRVHAAHRTGPEAIIASFAGQIGGHDMGHKSIQQITSLPRGAVPASIAAASLRKAPNWSCRPEGVPSKTGTGGLDGALCGHVNGKRVVHDPRLRDGERL